MNRITLNIVFILYVALAFLVALYHFHGVFYPGLDNPAWRHGFFVMVNLLIVYGLIRRGAWFVWFIGILTLQQWNSHGSYVYMRWQKGHVVEWMSIAIIVLLPLLFILLLKEQKHKKRG